MATRRSSAVLLGALVLWVAFGSWSLFRPDVGDASGLDPVVGHIVVFFFISLAAFGLTTRRLGTVNGLTTGVVVVAVAAAVSEWLQPILTDTRQAEQSDLIGNWAGILGAVVVAITLAASLDESRRVWVTAGLCVGGFVGVSAITAFGVEEVRVVWECRDRGLRPITDIRGSPIIHTEGETVIIGARGEPSTDPLVTAVASVSRPLDDALILDSSRDLRCSAIRAGEMTVRATVVPESSRPNGPTRIFTSSAGTGFGDANIHIGQQLDALSVRIRSGRGYQWELIPQVFAAGRAVTVAVAVDGGDAVVFVDGIRRTAFELRKPSFLDWDPGFPILIGDEFTRDRTFEGEIVSVSVFDRALRPGDPLLG